MVLVQKCILRREWSIALSILGKIAEPTRITRRGKAFAEKASNRLISKTIYKKENGSKDGITKWDGIFNWRVRGLVLSHVMHAIT